MRSCRADRLMGAMAVLSGVLGFGGGMGLVITGLLMRGDAGYHRVFWFTAAFVVLVIVAVLVVGSAPPAVDDRVGGLGRRGRTGGRAVTAAAGHHPGQRLGLELARGPSAAGLGGALHWAVVVVGSDGASQPLVSTVMLTRRSMLLTNIATVAVGMGLYFGFLGLTGFVQAPTDSRLRLRRHRAGGQCGVPASRRARRVRHRPGQRSLYRPLRRAARCSWSEPSRA